MKKGIHVIAPFIITAVTLSIIYAVYSFSASCVLMTADPFMFPYDNSCHYSSAEYSGNVAANGDTAATYHNASLTHSVRFLYLLQTEICLPSNLLTNEALGDGHLDFHVIVLSFKQRCDDNSLPHVDYIFNSSTTWTTGRNILYETAMKYLFVLHIYG